MGAAMRKNLLRWMASFTVAAVAAGSMTAVGVTAVPPAGPAAATGQPAPLLLQIAGFGDLPPAQQTALTNFQTQAINDVLTEHMLPPSDAAAVQTWGRNTALAAYW